MARVVHFELTAASMERATAFYADAFGWAPQEWEGPMAYRFLITGPESAPGIDGAVVPREEATQPVTLTVEVDSLADTLGRVERAGGRVLDAGHAIPGLGSLGAVEDTEGNRFAVLERSREGGP